MRLPTLTDKDLIETAGSRTGTLSWRLTTNTVFAAAAALVLGSLIGPALWLAVMAATLSFDAWLARQYMAAKDGQARDIARAQFTSAYLLSIVAFSSLALAIGVFGGGAGRLLTVFMASSSLLSILVYVYRSPAFLLLASIPGAICLILVPFMSLKDGEHWLTESIGVSLGVIAFAMYLARSAIRNERMFGQLRALSTQAMQAREAAEARAEEAEMALRVKGEFLNKVSHELRTPLNAIIGYSELVLEDLESGGHAEAADVSRIRATGLHLFALIDQVLELKDLDANVLDLSIDETDVAALVRSSVETATPQAALNGNQIEVQGAQSPLWARIDEAKVEKCLEHLLTNACKFTSDGRIVVTLESVCDAGVPLLAIAIADTGVGISTEQIANLFLPFAQVDNSITRAHDGVGLGLAVTRKLARLMGGEVSVVSALGNGSTFTLLLPSWPRRPSNCDSDASDEPTASSIVGVAAPKSGLG